MATHEKPAVAFVTPMVREPGTIVDSPITSELFVHWRRELRSQGFSGLQLTAEELVVGHFSKDLPGVRRRNAQVLRQMGGLVVGNRLRGRNYPLDRTVLSVIEMVIGARPDCPVFLQQEPRSLESDHEGSWRGTSANRLLLAANTIVFGDDLDIVKRQVPKPA